MSDIDENTVYSLAVEEHLFGKKDAVNTNENAYNDNASHISSWTKAYKVDELSAFGGVVALNRNVDRKLADYDKWFQASFGKDLKNILSEHNITPIKIH